MVHIEVKQQALITNNEIVSNIDGGRYMRDVMKISDEIRDDKDYMRKQASLQFSGLGDYAKSSNEIQQAINHAGMAIPYTDKHIGHGGLQYLIGKVIDLFSGTPSGANQNLVIRSQKKQ
jgi:hypothetical protein